MRLMKLRPPLAGERRPVRLGRGESACQLARGVSQKLAGRARSR